MCFSADDMRLIGDAIAAALLDAFKDPKLSEPQLVANLVRELPKHINSIRLSGTTKVSAGGVFVHARPFVTCTSFPVAKPSSVEIGDLLLIRTLVVNNKVDERRALLLQAKKADSIPATPDNQNQWHLYEQWPQFTYSPRSGRLTGKSRHIKEPDMYDAAKYLLIGTDAAARHWHRMCCVGWPFHRFYHWPEICVHQTAQPTKPEISRYRCFIGELVEFLAGNAGKVFDKPASRTRGWNRVIYDLITETAKAKTIFMGRAAQQSGKSVRGSGALSFMTPTKQSAHFLVADGNDATNSNIPPDVLNIWSQEEDGGGISIIEVVVQQGED